MTVAVHPHPTKTASEAGRCREALGAQGWCILRNALPAATISALHADLAGNFATTPFGEGGFYGRRTRRFGRLLMRSDLTAQLVEHAVIRQLVDEILLPWCDSIQLNTTQAIAVHPGAPAQFPHRDQDMWPAPKGTCEYLVNVMWPLTPFREDNGATLVWSGSHGDRALDEHWSGEPEAAEMKPGDALIFLGSTLHGAGANHSPHVRRGIVIGYSLGWLKPYENQWLAYPPAVAKTFSRDLAALVGYRQHRPNLGNYEGQCPSVLLGDTIDYPLGAIDALRPDQAELVEAHAAAQESSG